MTEKPNTFQEMEEKKKTISEEQPQEEKQQEAPKSTGEIDIADLSDTAVGEQVKYTRPDLDGKEDVISRFQVFMPDINNTEPKLSQAKTCEYWKVTMILTYESKNEDDVNNREYISGCRCFKQRDGSASQPSFWYNGSETQSAYVWELVAKKLEKDPEEMSPREFVAYLNSKPKMKHVGKEYKNYGAAPGSPKMITKNMPGEFL